MLARLRTVSTALLVSAVTLIASVATAIDSPCLKILVEKNRGLATWTTSDAIDAEYPWSWTQLKPLDAALRSYSKLKLSNPDGSSILSPVVLEGINDYTGGSYAAVVRAMGRAGGDYDKVNSGSFIVDRDVRRLRTAFEQSALPIADQAALKPGEELRLFRGEGTRFWGEFVVGKRFSTVAPMSTTLDSGRAYQNFTNTAVKTVMEIRVPATSRMRGIYINGLPIEGHSQFEFEMLLPPNIEFEVMEVHYARYIGKEHRTFNDKKEILLAHVVLRPVE